MFRQTILVAASLLGVACLVLGEEAPRAQKPQPTIQRRKTYSRKIYQQKRSPAVFVPQVKIQPCTPAQTPPVASVPSPVTTARPSAASVPPPAAGVQPPPAGPQPPADDPDRPPVPPSPQAVPPNSGSPQNSGPGSADVGNGPENASVVSMPPRAGVDEKQQLFLTPGGKYTAEDIKANGKMTAAQKYAGFRPSHDPNPKPGDKICPITDTKANPKCTWIVGGKTYQFCCPPCIEEFVRLAKENPDKIKNSEDYVQK